jgi:transcriptional regulator with PAS, ATPase and Fis domain
VIRSIEGQHEQGRRNRRAQAQPILVDAVKKMTVTDAKGILSGGNDSATQYLNKTSREQIRAKFLPIVKQATDKVGLAQQYNAFAGQAATWA